MIRWWCLSTLTRLEKIPNEYLPVKSKILLTSFPPSLGVLVKTIITAVLGSLPILSIVACMTSNAEWERMNMEMKVSWIYHQIKLRRFCLRLFGNECENIWDYSRQEWERISWRNHHPHWDRNESFPHRSIRIYKWFSTKKKILSFTFASINNEWSDSDPYWRSSSVN